MKKIAADILPLTSLTRDDWHNFVQWVHSIDNGFRKESIYIPRTVMTRALADGEPVAYVPLRNVLMFGELAPKPGTSPLQVAQGLKAISALVDQAANDAGIGEAWFTCTDRTEVQLCVKRGWEVVMHDLAKNMWLLRRRVPSTEPIW